MIDMLKSLIIRFGRAQSGASAVLFVLMIPVFIGMAAVVIDLNYARQVERAMQTSADAAALAASMDIGTASDPIARATSYAATSGGYNTIPGVTVTMVSGWPKMGCITPTTSYGQCTISSGSASTGCNSSGGCNVIYVKETATVPTIFSHIFGVGALPITVSAAAAGHGGASKELDVVLILDTTASMSTYDPGCGSSRLACAEAGAKTLMQTLNPAYDNIAVMVFPGLLNATYAADDSSCAGGSVKTGSTAPYNSSPAPIYQIAPSSPGAGPLSDYWTSSTDNTLNTTSALVKTVGYSGCSGVANPGGQGTFYADVVTTAQNYLLAHGRTAAQKVIIILTDGAATGGSATYPENECGQAVQAASAAKATGTVVYTIGYGADTSSCATDAYTATKTRVASSAYKINGILVPPYPSPCAALGAMATDSAHFFYDSGSACTGGQPAGTLQNAFRQIANQLMSPILFPYSG